MDAKGCTRCTHRDLENPLENPLERTYETPRENPLIAWKLRSSVGFEKAPATKAAAAAGSVFLD